MDSASGRRRLLEIQAELAELNPRAPTAGERAEALRAEISAIAAAQRRDSSARSARAFGEQVSPTGYDAPVEALESFLESVAGSRPADRQPPTPEESHRPPAPPQSPPPTPRNEDSR